MALSLKTNGSSSPNIITSTWFNDFYNLFTGSMQDQLVTFKNNLVMQAIGAAPSSAPTLALASGTTLGIGAYRYYVTFLSTNGESGVSPVGTITTTTGNQKVNLSAIPTGPTGTTGRNIYRSDVASGPPYYFLATLADNTTTTYSDTTSDSTLNTHALLGGFAQMSNLHPNFGGGLNIQDSSNNKNIQLFTDGALALASYLMANSPPTTINGSVSGTVSFYTPIWGTGMKVFLCLFNNYDTASVASFNFPTLMNQMLFGVSGNFASTTPTFSFFKGGTIQNVDVITALASGGGSATAVTTAHENSIFVGHGNQPYDQFQLGTFSSSTQSGVFAIGV